MNVAGVEYVLLLKYENNFRISRYLLSYIYKRLYTRKLEQVKSQQRWNRLHGSVNDYNTFTYFAEMNLCGRAVSMTEAIWYVR